MERRGWIGIKLQREVQRLGEESRWESTIVCRILSFQDLEKQRKRSRFQKEDGECSLKVSNRHPEDVLRDLSGVTGLKRQVRATDTKVENRLHGQGER